jgi:hypothetical protein
MSEQMMSLDEIQKIAEHLINNTKGHTAIANGLELYDEEKGIWQEVKTLSCADVLMGMLTPISRGHNRKIFRISPVFEIKTDIYEVRFHLAGFNCKNTYTSLSEAKYFSQGNNGMPLALWNITTNELLDFKNISKQTEELIRNV